MEEKALATDNYVAQVRIENSKYATDLINATHELNIEWDKLENIRKEIYAKLDSELNGNDFTNISGKIEELGARIASFAGKIGDYVGKFKDVNYSDISSSKDNPVGFLYIDRLGGEYATVYTSEEKMTAINTPFKKYSQIVNPAHMVMFVLNEDMDGLIINPGNEQILLTRETLLDYSGVIEKTCNNEKLNKAMLCMFLMEV